MAKVTFATPPAELNSDQDYHPGFHNDQLREWQVANSPYPGDVGNLPSPPEYFSDSIYQHGLRTDVPLQPLYAPPSPPPPAKPPRPTAVAGQTPYTPNTSAPSPKSFDGKLHDDELNSNPPQEPFHHLLRSSSPPPPAKPPRPTLKNQASTSSSSARESYHDSLTKSPQLTAYARNGPSASNDGIQIEKHSDAVELRDEQQQQQTTTDATTDAPPVAGKKSFQDRMYRWSNKAGVHVNRVTNKLGCEAWWPMPLDKECDKCARILRSFVKDGVYTPGPTSPYPSATSPTPDSFHYPGPKTSSSNPTKNTLIKIPQSVLQNAKGLAIFTAFRTGGPQLGGAGGSGVVTIRLPDGSWSPPSGILPNNLSFGFMLGFDVYDCVCVLNTDSAVDAFTKRARVSLGGDIAMVAGPVGTAAQFDKDFGGGGIRGMADQPVWCYVKSRGFYAGVSVDGTVVVERPDANGMFYGEKGIMPGRILKGEVKEWEEGRRAEDGSRMWPEGGRLFIDTVREAEGRAGIDGMGMEVAIKE